MNSGDLVISYAGLQSASNDYALAAEQFSTATDKMIEVLTKTEEVWKDASSAEWQSKITKAKTTFIDVAAKLKNNSAVLTSINNAVNTSSGNVQTAVSNM